jgi:HrpA-like RNA helicase
MVRKSEWHMQVPEMARRELTGALLQLKALGVDSLAEFDFLSPPPPELAAKGVEALHVLGALDADARCLSAADSLCPDRAACGCEEIEACYSRPYAQKV